MTVNTDDCLLFAGNKNGRGYGYIWTKENGKDVSYAVHRLMYEEAKGPIPEGLVIDHLCSTPACFNPDHLEAVTQVENKQRKYGVGLCKRGHTLDGNVYTLMRKGNQHRTCKTCSKARQKFHYYKYKAIAAGVKYEPAN